MDGFTTGILRTILVAGLAILICIIVRPKLPRAYRDYKLLLLGSVFNFVIWPVLFSIGIEFTSAGHAAVIMAMIPVFTVLIGSMVKRQFPVSGWWLGAGIAFLASVLLFVTRGLSMDWLAEGTSLKGDGIILSGCIFCAAGYVAGGSLSRRIGTFATTFWSLSASLVFVGPVFVFHHPQQWSDLPAAFWWALGWMVLLSSVLGYILWYHALAKGGVRRIGSLQLIMPVLTLILAVMVLDEELSTLLVLICLTILFGVYWAQRHLR